jgi:MFS transporter, DHA1 family, multidrug resistance protein
MSELYGRKRPLFVGHFLFIICQIPVGVAQNIETIMLFRFLGGVCSAGPIAICAGQFADFFDPVQRGVALTILSAMTLIGPVLGPLIGSFITNRCVL